MPNPITMDPGRWNTTAHQGSTFERTLTISGFDASEFDYRGQVRKSHTDSQVLANLIVTALDANTITVGLTAANTAAIPAGSHVFDIELYTEGFVARFLEGRIRITPEVTR